MFWTSKKVERVIEELNGKQEVRMKPQLEFNTDRFVKRHLVDVTLMFPKNTGIVAQAVIVCQNSDTPNTYGCLLSTVHRLPDTILASFVTQGSLLKLLYDRGRRV